MSIDLSLQEINIKENKCMPYCTNTIHPEMVRNYEDNEPCNDGSLN